MLGPLLFYTIVNDLPKYFEYEMAVDNNMLACAGDNNKRSKKMHFTVGWPPVGSMQINQSYRK